jgi:nucleotide-binding universal stress UspA family protein
MENQLASIASFKKLHVGSFVKEKFELEGLECFLTDEGFGITGDNVPKGFSLKVKVADTEKAVSILLKIHKDYDFDKIRKESSIKDKRKILVPIDISNYNFNACEYAFGLAERTNAEVKLLYVYTDPSLNGPVKHTTAWEKHAKIEAAEAYKTAQVNLVSFGQELRKHIGEERLNKVKMHYALLKGRPAIVIAALCKRYKPGLIIMGPKGKGEKKGTYMGSVTTSVIEHTKYPVLTVPKSAKYLGLELINIMYATDFNESDNTSLNKLLEIVSPFKTRIHCIHIDIESDKLKQGKVDELNLQLKKDYSKHDIQCSLIESSNIIKGFEEFISKNNIALISFSEPRHTLFYKIFHPNKLKKMVSTSKIPMLVFPV